MSGNTPETRREAYKAKLRDPRWQKMRLKIFERDKFKCQHCGDHEETLHIHHLQYSPGCDPWDYPMEWLITLCEGCHEDETQFRRQSEEELLRVLRLSGFSVSDLDYLAHTLETVPFCCSKSEFVEFFNWMMEESQEEHVREYFQNGLSSDFRDAEDA